MRNHTYVRTVKVYSESNDDEINYIVCNNNETLLWLINLGCIEIHPWNSRVNDYVNAIKGYHRKETMWFKLSRFYSF